MKVRADEHVAPKIVQVLRIIALSTGWELTGVREFHAARTLDETWLPRFASEGGKAIITADVWAQARRNIQAASLIYFWPEIEATLTTAQAGEFWRVPTTLYAGSLEKLRVNYAAAAQAAQRP